MNYVIGCALLYLLVAMMIGVIAHIVRSLRGRPVYWPWERNFWLHRWLDLRIGLCGPYLLWKRFTK